MDITVTNYKGGVGKTTTAIHLAAILQENGPTLLIDGDENRSASIWASAGKLPFQVARPNQSHKYVRECRHVVFDTKGRPEPQDMADLAEGCDLIVLPTSPKALDLDAVFTTVEVLQELKATTKCY